MYVTRYSLPDNNMHIVQLNLNFTHACGYMCVLARLTHAKLQKLACVCTFARNFGVRIWDSKHMWHTRDARHELALGLPHYTCGVTTGTVAVGNKYNCFEANWLLFMLWWASLENPIEEAWPCQNILGYPRVVSG